MGLSPAPWQKSGIPCRRVSCARPRVPQGPARRSENHNTAPQERTHSQSCRQKSGRNTRRQSQVCVRASQRQARHNGKIRMEVRPADPLQGRFWLHDTVGAGNKILRSGDPDKKHRSTPARNNAGQIESLSPGYGVPEKKICPDLPLCRHIEGHSAGLLPEGGRQDKSLRLRGSFEGDLPG